ncbi:MAG: hypothetical protein ACI4YB_02600 [Oscillospiraceae bacterium]
MISDFGLNGFNLPVILKKDFEYYVQLCDYLDKYNSTIQRFDILPPETKRSTSENCDFIKQSIKNYYNARIIDAHKNISNILGKYITDYPFLVSPLNESYAFRGCAPEKLRNSVYKETNKANYEEMMEMELNFYRARTSQNPLECKDMLHIPFNLRGKISTQRFSIPGVPCFYFSTTSLGAWLELGMPEATKFQVSEYTLPSDITVLNLCFQQHLINGKSSFINTNGELSDFLSSVEIFPLIIATSFKIEEENRNFKSEYIVSQLIMQVANSIGIDAVAYLSKRINDLSAYPQCVNLAILIPQKDIDSEELYWEYAHQIALTAPICFADFIEGSDVKSTFKPTTLINKTYQKPNISDRISIFGQSINYTDTMFSRFDEYLHKLEKRLVL